MLIKTNEMKGQTDKINYKLKYIKNQNINAPTQMIIAEKIYVLCSKYQKDIIQIPYIEVSLLQTLVVIIVMFKSNTYNV